MWELTRIATEFFEENLPWYEMKSANDLISANSSSEDDGEEAPTNIYCFAKAGQVYAVYLPTGQKVKLDLNDYQGAFEVSWFDPLRGGALTNGTVSTVQGPGEVELGDPPSTGESQDWVALVRSKKSD